MLYRLIINSYKHLLNSVRRIVFSGIISGNGRQYRNYCDSQNAHGTPEGEQSIREPDITPSWLGFEYCGSNIAAGSNSYCEWHVHIRMYAPCYAPHNVSGSIRRVINGWIVCCLLAKLQSVLMRWKLQDSCNNIFRPARAVCILIISDIFS